MSFCYCNAILSTATQQTSRAILTRDAIYYVAAAFDVYILNEKWRNLKGEMVTKTSSEKLAICLIRFTMI